jgi:hypothetical protein
MHDRAYCFTAGERRTERQRAKTEQREGKRQTQAHKDSHRSASIHLGLRSGAASRGGERLIPRKLVQNNNFLKAFCHDARERTDGPTIIFTRFCEWICGNRVLAAQKSHVETNIILQITRN